MTKWKWDVGAITSGSHKLYLVLNTVITVDGEKAPRTIRTFDHSIEVKVKFTSQVATFFDNNWQWLWAAIIVPIAGFLWKRRKGSEGA